MGLSKSLSFLVPLGVFSCLQLTFAADPPDPSADPSETFVDPSDASGDFTCAPEACGTAGAGRCIIAGSGYVCMCNEGFTAHSDPPICTSNEDEERRVDEEATSEGSTNISPSGEGNTAGEPPTERGQLPPGAGEGSEQPRARIGEPGVGNEVVVAVPEKVEPADVSTPSDPCSTNPCGNPDTVECIPIDDGDGSFGCRCKVGYVPGFKDGQQDCLAFSWGACEHAPCNPGHGCVVLDSGYRCVCTSGFHSVVQSPDGNPSCVADSEGDVCSHNGCGTQDAVRGCYPGEGGARRCVCNDGYNLVSAPDGGPICRAPGEEAPAAGVLPYPLEGPQGTEGQPEGPQGQEPGIVGPHGYGEETTEEGGAGTQQGGQASGYEGTGGDEVAGYGEEKPSGMGGETSHGRATGGEGEGQGGSSGTQEESKEESSSGNGTLIAGGVIGALILVAAAGGGAAMYKKSQSRGDESLGREEVDFEPSAQATVEVEPDESEILINVSQNDWAS